MHFFNKEVNIYEKINDPYGEYQWGMRYSNFDYYFDKIGKERLHNVKVAVIDSGIDMKHEDFDETIQSGWNFVDSSADVSDKLGHGTAVTGVIAAKDNNGIGIAGMVHGVRILPLKVINSSNESNLAPLIQAIYYAIQNEADVINISMGYVNAELRGIDFQYVKLINNLQKAIYYAASQGIVIVAAVGNCPFNLIDYPAACDNVIAVGSYGIHGKEGNVYISKRNSYSIKDVIYAPGEYIISTLPENQYGYRSGSSLATPFVTSAVAAAKALNKKIDFQIVDNLLIKSANCYEKDGMQYKLLNIDRFIEKVGVS
ncbi:S8 family peptidase [Lachnotalea glycerini]|uniref:Peptidase S8/S53 domain-containing protein n=1 Tax=Lachnotalea glycerini TaxID=1763509 RepID=A0A371JB79_9FIRM|nr:S8 family serine peptidase [Lachnotalea glycerini]RDY30015.1 hypothetical protein CG710_016915 [Lachnotalea glycerini]